MDNIIDIKRLWLILRKNMLLMIVWGIVFAGAAFGISKFVIQPEYSSSVALLVNRKQDENTGEQFQNQQADVQMINTYKDIITRPVILETVVKNLTTTDKQLVKKAQPATYKTLADGTQIIDKQAQPAEYKVVDAKYDKSEINTSDLSQNISISNQQNSQIFTVNVTLKSSKLARDAANEIAKVFKQKVSSIMSVSNVSVVSKAVNNTNPVSPNVKLITLAGLVIGIFVGFIWGLIKELTDRTVKDVSYLTDELNLTNLGQINFIGKLTNIDKVVNTVPKSESPTRSRSSRRI
ncbi:YveK family protein [Weissella paramesenteroides]|uniref:YveK family protein n=1 Tax=Weissella paramesenteroides TaxID=1249 RepID=UPI00123A8FD8|nr:Wzz/FepE/Etk N-terminal domain-containing protein [Weissella paramesenteroides]KAA8453760.1 capsular biosynthesis protein [Weissella paramesenteroides]KAA8457757.1 capsular biosynthesis protein [Weissella paramesenteroides]KAA8460268.1 capsular biosynthesis protein [Weissella paramesenteroides]KAA8460786.1 capsular biosynthesis protein [Weissella paramesenteroides]KAA8461650.1 capsular biosynthesis protein [Weissella paramesenteroides]